MYQYKMPDHVTCPSCGQIRPTTPDELDEDIIRSWNRYTVNLTRGHFYIYTGPEGELKEHFFAFTPNEILYLLAMVRATGRTCPKHYLLEYVAGDKPDVDMPGIKIVDVKIFKLRKILKEFSSCITTDWGRGYRLRAFDPTGKLLP